MENTNVSDLMVPIEEYATVSQEATLFEAVMALENAQENLDRSRYKYLHRAVLALDKNGKVVGKIGQLDVIKALEPKYREIEGAETMSRAGFSPQFLKDMMQRHTLWDKPMKDLCSKAVNMKVKDFMFTPTRGEFVDEKASLDEAVHRLVMGAHQSLLVTRDNEITGILRLTDVFLEVWRNIKACKI